MHFSVNRMLTAECYKQRLERGLTFMEFNYMLMQSYDFLVLNQKYGAVMQLGRRRPMVEHPRGGPTSFAASSRSRLTP